MAVFNNELYGEKVKQILMDAILTGNLKPGDRIVETRWAKELGISQAPVREAIKQMESINLVKHVPFQGAFVNDISPKDMKDAYLVRMKLESLGVRESVKHVTQEQLVPIENSLRAIEKAAADNDFMRYIEQDVMFHQLIMELSGNEFLLRIWKLCDIKEWTVLGTRWSQFPLEKLGYRHQAIFDALKNRDVQQLIAESQKHTMALIKECENQEMQNGKIEEESKIR